MTQSLPPHPPAPRAGEESGSRIEAKWGCSVIKALLRARHWQRRAPLWRLALSMPRALQTWSAPSSSFAPGFPSQYSITHNRAYRDLAPKKKVLAGRTLCLPSASARHRLLSGPRTPGARRHPSEPERPYAYCCFGMWRLLCRTKQQPAPPVRNLQPLRLKDERQAWRSSR